MILSTRGKLILSVLNGYPKKGFPAEIFDAATRKATMLDAAQTLGDLRIPPANRLESLQGDRKGQHSIRINNQWRICFVWTDQGPTEVEIVDYHR